MNYFSDRTIFFKENTSGLIFGSLVMLAVIHVNTSNCWSISFSIIEIIDNHFVCIITATYSNLYV